MPGPSSSPPPAPVAVNNSNVSTTTSRWASSLPDDLVRLIASHVPSGDLLHYVRFRAVCALWRSATACPRGRGVVDPRFHPRRWMMLPEGDGLHPGHPRLHGYVRFFNLDTGAFVRVHTPLFEDHCILDYMDGGLLVLQRDHDTAIRVLHPFTSDILELPPLSTLLPQLHAKMPGLDRSRRKMLLRLLMKLTAAATFAADGVVTVMLALTRMKWVAVATQQDLQWALSTWQFMGTPILSSQGKIYVVCWTFGDNPVPQILQTDTPLPGDETVRPPKLIATYKDTKFRGYVSLVECDSEILAIFYGESHTKILVYRLSDLVMERYVPVTSIGDCHFHARQEYQCLDQGIPCPQG